MVLHILSGRLRCERETNRKVADVMENGDRGCSPSSIWDDIFKKCFRCVRYVEGYSSTYSYRCLCILIVVYVYLLLFMYSYCSSTYSYRCLCMLIVVYVFLDAATLTEVSPCFFLGCKANSRV